MRLAARTATAVSLTAGMIASAALTMPAAGATPKYTLAQVKAHNKASDCWTTINGSVYNLTKWIPRHPGGQAVIRSLCGTNGTAAFRAKHSARATPLATLARYRIGILTASAKPSPKPTKPSAKPTPSPSSKVLTPALVATHATSTDCWSIVNGSVYNLTKWIPLHPGGARIIRDMCGIDASRAFIDKHGMSGAPASTLARYRIGALGAEPSPLATTDPSFNGASVQQHASASDCWVVINGSVYDFTTWITRHPGGGKVITAACGRDASAVFASEREHRSASNQLMLASFRIGAFDASGGTLQNAIRSDD